MEVVASPHRSTMVNGAGVVIGASTSASTTGTAKKRKPESGGCKKATKAARFNSTVTDKTTGNVKKVIMVPTENVFQTLPDDVDGNEVIMTSHRPAKARIPPITIFNLNRHQIDDLMKINNITKYSLKNLRHAIHLYCDTSDDFKTVRSKIAENNVNSYSHDLKEEKLYKVALKGLHRMSVKDLETELKSIDLEPIEIRVITPRAPRYASDVVYIISFRPGTVKLRDLIAKRIVCHTIVQWEPYRRKEGIIQCSRCQRPGHGSRNCNMPYRCCLCGGDHQTEKCPSSTTSLENAMGADGIQETDAVEVPVRARCCNCNIDGHFASDPMCPKKIAYMKSRRSRTLENKPGKARMTTGTPAIKFNSGGPSFADMLKSNSRPTYASTIGNGNLNVGPFDIHHHSGGFGPSGAQIIRSQSSPSGSRVPNSQLGPSGTDRSFSREELTALSFEIVNSLRDVRHLPREEAFLTVMNVAFKYLFND